VRTWQDVTVISGDVSPGERVVVEGHLRVTPGAKVRIVPRSGTSDTAGARSNSSQATEGRQDQIPHREGDQNEVVDGRHQPLLAAGLSTFRYAIF